MASITRLLPGWESKRAAVQSQRRNIITNKRLQPRKEVPRLHSLGLSQHQIARIWSIFPEHRPCVRTILRRRARGDAAARTARRESTNSGRDVLLVDTAGRLHLDDELMIPKRSA